MKLLCIYYIEEIKFLGANAVTNFDIFRYDIERLLLTIRNKYNDPQTEVFMNNNGRWGLIFQIHPQKPSMKTKFATDIYT
jgi:2-succinyl-5-enolpyruvyl-6-hydroxy-3-cyclohexene-1-carboxylate synthase